MGSIDQRPGGKWRARYRDPAGHQRAKHFETKREARAFLASTESAIDTRRWIDPKHGRVTFRDFVNDWQSRQIWESSTVTSFEGTIRQFPYADRPLDQIRRSHIETWIKEQSQTLAASTIHTRFVHVRQVFTAAVNDKLILDNPTQGVVLPRKRRREHAMKIPTPAQVRTMLDAAADDDTHLLIAMCAFAGLRLGEAVALQTGDVDFPHRVLHVQRQRQRNEVRPPKYGSERTVPLPDELLLLLAQRMERPIVEGWLFYGERGPAGDNWAHARFNKARKAASCPQVTVHSLRHFYASGLISAGCDVVTVQRALGHSKPSITLDTYSHLWPSAEDRTRSGAASIMSQVLSAENADSARTEAAPRAL